MFQTVKEKKFLNNSFYSITLLSFRSVNEALEKNDKEQLKEILSSKTTLDHLQRLSHKFLMCIFRHELDKIKCLVESGLPFNTLEDSHVHHHVVAMDQGHSDIAAYLIEQGADVNVTRPGTVSLAHVACRRNDHNFLQVLIAHNANIDAQCSVGFTPLMYACRYGSTNCVQKLLENGVNLNLTEKVFGRSALHLAAEKKDQFVTEILQMLLDAGIDPNISDRTGQPAVVYLIKNSESTDDSFEILIPASLKWLNTNIESIKGNIAHLAAEQGRVHALRTMVRNGADLSLKYINGHTVLHKAAISMCPETVSYVITLPGCSVNVQDNNGDTPLHLITSRMTPILAMNSCWEHDVVPLFVEQEQDFNLQNDRGSTPLILSLSSDISFKEQISGQIVVKLLPVSNVFIKDKTNRDALQYFIRHLERDTNIPFGSNILKEFRSAGIDIASYFKTYGRDAFISLANQRNGSVESLPMFKELIEAGVDVNLKKGDESALFCALRHSSRITLCMLLLANASFEVLDANQNHLIHSYCGHDKGILKLILQTGFNGRSIDFLLKRDFSDRILDDDMNQLLEIIYSVPSLLKLSCRKIRENISSCNAENKFKTLPLPPLLIDKVRYKDLITCINPSKVEQRQIERYC